MAITNGPALDSISADAREWYNTNRQYLIDILTEDAPSGSVTLTPAEQYQLYVESGSNGLATMRARFMNLYRGYPDAISRTEAQMARYITRMNQIGQLLRTNRPAANYLGAPNVGL